MTPPIFSPKKLIEVALPLDDINVAAAREKSIRHGHPSTLHLWWARRPLAAARAVLFAQMVNDPGETETGDKRFNATKRKIEAKRETLFQIIRELVLWENTNNEEVLGRARAAIWESWRETCHLNRKHPDAAELFNPEKLPAFHDPFAGGGAIPLEAQRLGLEAYASDLNPVAVMINKAMIEIPPKFAGRVPVGAIPADEKQVKMAEDWSGARGLAEDVRRYGHWMREQAFERIGHLYPQVEVTAAMAQDRADLKPYVGDKLTVIAWLWARTVKSPNPAFSHVDVPLVSSFILSSKAGKESWVEPIIDGDRYHFAIRTSKPPAAAKDGTKAARGANFTCLLSNTPIDGKHIKGEGMAGRMGAKLMAVVAEGRKGRVYLNPSDEMDVLAKSAIPTWKPETDIPPDKRSMFTPLYGLTKFSDLFTPRQLVALTTFSDLVQEARTKVIADAKAAGMADDGVGIDAGGLGATAYGDAVAVYLGITVSKAARFITSLSFWRADEGKLSRAFGRQAIPMTWDYAETNPFSDTGGDIYGLAEGTFDVLVKNSSASVIQGFAFQADAKNQSFSNMKVISTDPPYYDNIGYADLSDYFYVWLRRSLQSFYPQLFATLATPKNDELVANPYRHGNKDKAESFFLDGMQKAIRQLGEISHQAFPVTIYYAFKQSETKGDNTTSSGWSAFLEAVIRSGLSILGTWPVRTEGKTRMISMGNNALASSIVLVCRKRKMAAETISRREFQRELRNVMPEALETMIGGETGRSPIAPVDLAQAAIGPGMAIFSQYAAVLNQDGSTMSVHDALIMINREITDYLSPDSGNFDADTLFCSSWFDQYGWAAGDFGQADTLARAKGTSVAGVHSAGVIESGSGKVRLFKWAEYPSDWNPETDNRMPIWEATHHLIRALNQQGETAAGSLLARMPTRGEAIRQLAYHLYTLCERKKWADDARAYNELISAWSAIVAASLESGHIDEQIGLGF
ncbi:DUF1156 domain-containing protein [Thiothrix eikelboomii]|uniref:DUF1156 domain-containing protein n=1 Tax=Thiothrix eikelboomii TaxID=92487 RepID=UPI003BB0AEDB